MTPCKISAVSFSNILNMNNKKIKKLIFTALTPIFVPCSGSERLRQSQDLRQYKWFTIPGTPQRLLDIWVASVMILSAAYLSSERRCCQITRSDLLSGTDHRKIPGANNSNDLEKYKASGVEYY